MSSEKLKAIDAGNYISFATRKRSGDLVATPVWFAPDSDEYIIFSAADAGKVKRLRNFSESRIAPCTVTGKVTGDWVEAESIIVDGKSDQTLALKALHRKYGWQMAMTDLMSRLSGKFGKRSYIRVKPLNS